MKKLIDEKIDFILTIIDNMVDDTFDQFRELDDTFQNISNHRRDYLEQHQRYLYKQIHLLKKMIETLDPSPLDNRAVLNRIYHLTIEPLMELAIRPKTVLDNDKLVILAISNLIEQEILLSEQNNQNGESDNDA